MQCLRDIEIGRNEMKYLINMYWGQGAHTRTEDGLSPNIIIKRRVRQGCVLFLSVVNSCTGTIIIAKLIKLKVNSDEVEQVYFVIC